MSAPASTSPALRGQAGLDPFAIATRSISGWYYSYKAPAGGRARQPYTSLLEHRLGLHLEYHPWVSVYQRGDLRPAWAAFHNLALPLGAPYAIGYQYEGVGHEYWPDWVGRTADGGLIIGEAGLHREKVQGRAQAKAAAARALTAILGGRHWIGTDTILPLLRHANLVHLHGNRQDFPAYAEIAPHLRAAARAGDPVTPAALIAAFASRWTAHEVEGAVWRLAAEAAAAGHLVVDLDRELFCLDTPFAVLPPDAEPIVPAELPGSLAPGEDGAEGDEEEEAQGGLLPGPAFDADAIVDERHRRTFLRNLAAVTEVLAGDGRLCDTARKYGMSHSRLSVLVARARELGQAALVPYRTYERRPRFDPAFEPLLRELYVARGQASIAAIAEDRELVALAERLGAAAGRPVLVPDYPQVYRYLAEAGKEQEVREARLRLRHPPRPRMSTRSYVLSIARAGEVVQVDEHTFNVKICTIDGEVLRGSVHGAAAICVATGAIVAVVLSLDVLKEEDYMRLIRRCMEPKDTLVRDCRCEHDWPCVCRPLIVLHDRGKIFKSAHATEVVVDRFGITTQQAPPYAPSVKGIVEGLWPWIERKLIERLAGTTKRSPAARGSYDSFKEAAKAGITLDVLEMYLVQAIVDDYMLQLYTPRRQTHIACWEADVRAKGVGRWLRGPDELLLLLMKAANPRNTATGRYAINAQKGISFLSRWYGNPEALGPLLGRQVDIYYDRQDVSAIHLYCEGHYVGPAVCPELAGRRVSVWEARAERKRDAAAAKAAEAQARTGRQRTQGLARRPRKEQRAEALRLERARLADQGRGEVHPAATLRLLDAEAARAAVPAAPAASDAPLPPVSAGVAPRPARTPRIWD